MPYCIPQVHRYTVAAVSWSKNNLPELPPAPTAAPTASPTIAALFDPASSLVSYNSADCGPRGAHVWADPATECPLGYVQVLNSRVSAGLFGHIPTTIGGCVYTAYHVYECITLAPSGRPTSAPASSAPTAMSAAPSAAPSFRSPTFLGDTFPPSTGPSGTPTLSPSPATTVVTVPSAAAETTSTAAADANVQNGTGTNDDDTEPHSDWNSVLEVDARGTAGSSSTESDGTTTAALSIAAGVIIVLAGGFIIQQKFAGGSDARDTGGMPISKLKSLTTAGGRAAMVTDGTSSTFTEEIYSSEELYDQAGMQLEWEMPMHMLSPKSKAATLESQHGDQPVYCSVDEMSRVLLAEAKNPDSPVHKQLYQAVHFGKDGAPCPTTMAAIAKTIFESETEAEDTYSAANFTAKAVTYQSSPALGGIVPSAIASSLVGNAYSVVSKRVDASGAIRLRHQITKRLHPGSADVCADDGAPCHYEPVVKKGREALWEAAARGAPASKGAHDRYADPQDSAVGGTGTMLRSDDEDVYAEPQYASPHDTANAANAATLPPALQPRAPRVATIEADLTGNPSPEEDTYAGPADAAPGRPAARRPRPVLPPMPSTVAAAGARSKPARPTIPSRLGQRPHPAPAGRPSYMAREMELAAENDRLRAQMVAIQRQQSVQHGEAAVVRATPPLVPATPRPLDGRTVTNEVTPGGPATPVGRLVPSTSAVGTPQPQYEVLAGSPVHPLARSVTSSQYTQLAERAAESATRRIGYSLLNPANPRSAAASAAAGTAYASLDASNVGIDAVYEALDTYEHIATAAAVVPVAGLTSCNSKPQLFTLHHLKD